MSRRRKSKAVEIVLIMLGFGVAAIANALSRGTVEQEVAASIQAAKLERAPIVSLYDLP